KLSRKPVTTTSSRSPCATLSVSCAYAAPECSAEAHKPDIRMHESPRRDCLLLPGVIFLPPVEQHIVRTPYASRTIEARHRTSRILRDFDTGVIHDFMCCLNRSASRPSE